MPSDARSEARSEARSAARSGPATRSIDRSGGRSEAALPLIAATHDSMSDRLLATRRSEAWTTGCMSPERLATLPALIALPSAISTTKWPCGREGGGPFKRV